MATTLKLIAKRPLGGNVWLFEFEPSRPLRWIAGQFIRVELPHSNPDAEGTKRQFTIAAAPHQPVRVATRITQSSFKQALADLPIGDTLNLLDPPAGTFVWQEQTSPLVFVAQGIGITPFVSMLADRHHQSLPLSATLVHANLTPKVPFATELQAWAAADPRLILHFLDHQVTAAELADLVPDLNTAAVYVSGPRPLTELLLPPFRLSPHQLKSDLFPNYPASAY